MLIIVEGANYVGKTTTLEELKNKKPKWMFAYHPRFNEEQYLYFDYYVKNNIAFAHNGEDANKIVKKTSHVHRDIVYQISHLTCLKYLKTMHENHIIVCDRCFMSEMVYNELHDKQIYRTFCDVLKSIEDYKIFYLSVDSDEELKKRIVERLKADNDKRFGVRIDGTPNGENVDEDVIESRFEMQRKLDKRYREEFDCSKLNVETIDTSFIKQKQVAKLIIYKVEVKA
jgi:thymidylate kinase